MDLIKQIEKGTIPNHIAVIMDGNGRWAKKKGMSRVFGHKNGIKSVRSTIEAAAEANVKFLTLYAFSTENWNRPALEVKALMALLVSSLRKELKTLQQNKVRLQAIGNIDDLPKNVAKELKEVIEQTASNDLITVSLALSYGSRNEIVNSFLKISKKIVNGELQAENIDEKIINNHLYTFNLPDVDLLIRTSGEQRISNFLLWQIAYAELYFTNTPWPEFNREEFLKAIIEFQNRERRFGKTSEQIEEINES